MELLKAVQSGLAQVVKFKIIYIGIAETISNLVWFWQLFWSDLIILCLYIYIYLGYISTGCYLYSLVQCILFYHKYELSTV
jgi:hypothetical protein